jgi:hypothetical protein
MENSNIQLNLQDLDMLRNIISVACNRGAFKAEEMSTVGQTYDRLHAFLESLKPAQEEIEQDQNSTGDSND